MSGYNATPTEKPLNVIWVDDQVGDVVNTWGSALQERLRGSNISLLIKALDHALGVREVLEDHGADLLILDIDLDHDRDFPNAFLLLERLTQARISRPVVLVSGRALEYERELDQYSDRYLGMFEKSSEGMKRLADFIAKYVERPPVTALVMSDLHVGRFAQDRAGLERFMSLLERDFEQVRRAYQVNHLIMLGDFVWQGRAADLPIAYEIIRRIRNAMSLSKPNAFHFCPGNHDVDLKSKEPWEPIFRELVNQLAVDDGGVKARYEDDVRPVRYFHRPEDLVAFGPGASHGVGFASLCSPDIQEPKQSRIGHEQFVALKARMETVPDCELKIALMHHCLYPAPFIGQEAEAPIPADSARIYRELSRMGFQLLLTGHSHYSCVHTHELAVLNSRAPAPVLHRLVVVSLATLGGEPSQATPSQQYYVLRIGHQKADGTRRVEVASRVLDPEAEQFIAGQSVELELGKSEMTYRTNPQ
jgi:hypothetical protein